MNVTYRYRSGLHLALCALALGCLTLSACSKKESQESEGVSGRTSQPSEVEVSKQAVIAFDVNVKELIDSDIASQLPPEAMAEAMGPMGSQEMKALQSLSRIFGFVSAPPNLEAAGGLMMMAMGPPPGGLPFDFHVTVEFVDAAGGQELMDEIKAGGTVEMNGETLYTPDEGNQNGIFARIVSDTRLEIGTEEYMKIGSGNPATEALSSKWAAMSEAPIRLALDLDGARSLLDEVNGQLGQMGPTAAPFTAMISKASFLGIHLDPTGNQLAGVSVDTNSDADAESIANTVNMLLGPVNAMVQPEISRMKLQDAETAEVLETLWESVKPQQDGSNVSIVVNKPAGFDEALQRMAAAAQEEAAAVARLNEFKMIGLAVHNFHDTFTKFPFNPDGSFANENISWRVLVLPYVDFEYINLYDQFNVQEAWDSDANRELAGNMPAIYGEGGANANIVYVRPEQPVTTFGAVTGGSSNKVMLLETLNPVPWTQPADISPEEAKQMVLGLGDGESLRAVRYDGSAFELTNESTAEELDAMFDPRS